LSEVPGLISQLRKDPRLIAWLEEVGSERMTVEVCVRQQLMSEAFDDWRIQIGKTLVRLGYKYPVVLRPFERLYEQRAYWVDWRDKWEQLKRLATVPMESPVEWISQEDSGEALSERLMAPHVLCVASRHCCPQEHLQVSVDAGAPAMVWIRLREAQFEDAEALLEPLISGGRLAELPHRIHTARRQAREGALARSITLVWDDFDRIPPDAEDDSALSAPPVG
jgi:hypothetical protein